MTPRHLSLLLRYYLGQKRDVHSANLCMQSWHACVTFVSQAAEQQKNIWAGRVGERATLACDPLSPRRTGQADFPASGSPENVSPQACAGSCTAASLIDAPA